MSYNNDRQQRYMRRYRRAGLALIPLAPPRTGNSQSGKQPLLKGAYKAAVTGDEIAPLFAKHFGCNIGIVTGKRSGILVLDIDTKHGGHKTVRRLERELGPLPETWEVRTSNGGRHLYFQTPDDCTITRDTNGKIFGAGVDVLCEASHAVAPPSVHHTGHVYEWRSKSRLEIAPASLPVPWLDRLMAQPSVVGEEQHVRREKDIIPDGKRNSTLFKIACGRRAGGDGETEILQHLKKVNQERCEPPLELDELHKIVKSADKYTAGPQKADLATVIADCLLADRFASGLHLLHANKQFTRFTGTHWVDVTEDWIKKQGTLMIKTWPKRAHLKKAVLMSEVVQNLRASQEVDTDPFNSEPLPIVPCLNGELWLDDDGGVRLRRHRPTSNQRHVLPIDYDPDARSPKYDAALKQIFGEARDPESMVRHWHELVGYIIQPSRPLAVIVVLLGSGGNGKTKLVETLFQLMGQQSACFMNIDQLEDKFALNSLRGKLMFVDDDVKVRLRFPDSMLKKISEKKAITAEEKYKAATTFISRAIPFLLCNGVPHLQDPSDGILRRLQVLPFRKQFKGAEKNPTLFEDIWRDELPGILNRALEGWKRLRERKPFDFDLPKDVVRESTKWVQQAHPTSNFIEEETRRESNSRVLLSVLHKRFQMWAQEAGIQRPVTRPQFSQELGLLGYLVKKSNGHVTVYGLVMN